MKITVFLVDDHRVLRDGLHILLESQDDIEVVGEAEDGKKAIEGITRVKPDVAVMDITMPELNGIEAAQIIHETLPETGIVILSIHSDLEHIFRALQAGAQGYLLKESAGAEVISAVRAVHLGRRYLSPSIRDTVMEAHMQNRQIYSPLDMLSMREREVLQLTVESHSSAAIAEKLELSPKTVETYRSRLMGKLGVHDLPELVRFAIKHGITPID
ncbi:MAG: response regulator transcription factor [Anaerolineales bacterium]|nr:response regulator transcription factor [Anaerolineales bacterium]